MSSDVEADRAQESQIGWPSWQIAIGIIKYPFKKMWDLIDRLTGWLDNLANQYNG